MMVNKNTGVVIRFQIAISSSMRSPPFVGSFAGEGGPLTLFSMTNRVCIPPPVRSLFFDYLIFCSSFMYFSVAALIFLMVFASSGSMWPSFCIAVMEQLTCKDLTVVIMAMICDCMWVVIVFTSFLTSICFLRIGNSLPSFGHLLAFCIFFCLWL